MRGVFYKFSFVLLLFCFFFTLTIYGVKKEIKLQICYKDSIFNKHHLSLTSLIRFFGRRLFMAATYSPDFSVPLAQLCLTSLFGMGRGGTTLL